MNEKEALEICLDRITGQFETNGNWKRVSGNFDRYGPSMGILQFSFGAGGLQPLIKDVHRRGNLGDFFNPGDVRELLEILRWRTDKQRDFANRNWFNRGSWKPEREALEFGFKEMARSDIFRQAQIKGAQKYAKKATKLFSTYNFQTLRAWAIFFDIAVQNGGVRMTTREEIQLLRGETERTLGRKMSNIERLRTWIKIRASKSNPRWQADVLSRKMAILKDGGKVHGKKFDFRGLCLDRYVRPV